MDLIKLCKTLTKKILNRDNIPAKSITFNALGLTFSVSDNIYLHDDGYVKDVDKHLDELDSIYNVQTLDFSFLDLPSEKESVEKEGGIIAGCCKLYKNSAEEVPDNYHVHICYLKVDEPETDLALRVHEEVHAIDEINLWEKLADQIGQYEGFKIDFSNLPSEVRANIGSIYALRKNGTNIEDYIENTSFPDFKESSDNFCHSTFKTAWDLYNNQL